MTLALQGIEARVRELALGPVGRAGCELVDVEYRREPAGWTLRLYIDKEGGVSLDDCQRVSQEVGTVLEVEDPIPHRFNLEVSSPGLDRPLRTEASFRDAVGRQVRVAAREPIAGRRNFTGRLISVDPGAGGQGADVVLRGDAGEEFRIPLEAIAKANIVYEWPGKQPGSPSQRALRSGRKR
jgi:ribosome maturation factor RimP